MKAKESETFDLEGFLVTVPGPTKAKEYQRGQVIYLQGDPGDSLFYLQKGKVELVVASPKVAETVVAILTSGDFFGEACLAGHDVRMTAAFAVTACSLIKLEKNTMLSLLSTQPEFSEYFVSYLLSKGGRIQKYSPLRLRLW